MLTLHYPLQVFTFIDGMMIDRANKRIGIFYFLVFAFYIVVKTMAPFPFFLFWPHIETLTAALSERSRIKTTEVGPIEFLYHFDIECIRFHLKHFLFGSLNVNDGRTSRTLSVSPSCL